MMPAALLCLLLAQLPPDSTVAPAAQTSAADQPFVETIDRDFFVRTALDYRQLAFLIFDQTKQNSTVVTYRPNSNLFMGVSAGYKGLGFSGRFPLPGVHRDNATYGKTTAGDFQLYYFERQFGVDAFHQRYKGFYTSGMSVPSSVRDDMRMQNTGANAYYLFSDRLSLNAVFNQSERQVRTGYGFVLGASVSRFELSADGSVVPSGQNFGRFDTYEGGTYFNVSILPGFGLTFVPKNLKLFGDHLYMTFFVIGGLGLTKANAVIATGTEGKVTDNFKVNAKYAIGYNGDRLFGGSTIVLDLAAASTFTKSTFNVGAGVMFIEAFVGLRL